MLKPIEIKKIMCGTCHTRRARLRSIIALDFGDFVRLSRIRGMEKLSVSNKEENSHVFCERVIPSGGVFPCGRTTKN